MMLAGRRAGSARSVRFATMDGDGYDPQRARRFRDAALPHLSEVYTLARYLLRNTADAEDAVQECYLRALKHFDSFHGGAIRPWLFAILRNVCHSSYAQRRFQDEESDEDAVPLWGEAAETPEAQLLRNCDEQSIRDMIGALAAPYREVIVLREINDLSYREISQIIGAPVGTVMSRLARARSMLRAAWLAAGERRP